MYIFMQSKKRFICCSKSLMVFEWSLWPCFLVLHSAMSHCFWGLPADWVEDSRRLWFEKSGRKRRKGEKEKGGTRREGTGRGKERSQIEIKISLVTKSESMTSSYNTVLTWHCFTMCAPSATNTAWYSICSCTCTFNHQVATGTCSWAKLVCHQLACSTKNYQVITTKKFCAAALQIQ